MGLAEAVQNRSYENSQMGIRLQYPINWENPGEGLECLSVDRGVMLLSPINEETTKCH
jgi:hypothetical protein